MHWVAFNEASIKAQGHLWTGDPAAARWQAEGAPSCGATWQDYYCIDCKAIIKGEVHQDEDGNYYCSDCCDSPLCHIDLSDEPEPEWSLDDWCMCQGSSGHGPCPKCGKRMLPF